MTEQPTPFEQGFNGQDVSNPFTEGSVDHTQFADGQSAGKSYRASKQAPPAPESQANVVQPTSNALPAAPASLGGRASASSASAPAPSASTGSTGGSAGSAA